jgi:Tfp pilus assembly protein PilV
VAALEYHWKKYHEIRMKLTNSDKHRCGHSCAGIAVIEVIISMGVAAVAIGCIISGYLLAAKAAELSASSAAVQWSAIQALERTRSARWEPLAATPVDELVQTNFPTSVIALDIPLKKKKVAYATNRITITSLTGYPTLRMIRVETTWASSSRGPYTNSLITYRSADR